MKSAWMMGVKQPSSKAKPFSCGEGASGVVVPPAQPMQLVTPSVEAMAVRKEMAICSMIAIIVTLPPVDFASVFVFREGERTRFGTRSLVDKIVNKNAR